jgi:hypothetical protein
MSISINTTSAAIGIDRTASRLDMQSQNAQLELHSNPPMVNIRTERPTIEIDQYECFASVGLKGPVDLTREAAGRANQNALEYIGKVVADGNRLAAIENGGNPIAEMAKRDATTTHEFGIVSLPTARPRITVKGSMQVDPGSTGQGMHNGVEGNFTPANLNINYTPEKVNIFMRQYASVNINYQPENKIDTRI